ncbi:MAG TPA: NUDIX hydrolase [Acidobacteriota bacterium]|nr:NUDIX hydrolase [Acidobacteriota bacterium]
MAVVLSKDRREVLLLRREIFILWDLPGGKIEAGEEPEDAARRECLEESGYEIEIDRLVGRYHHQSVYGTGDQLTYLFLAHATGGTPKRFGFEVSGVRWCDVSDLPHGFQPLHRQMVQDALSNAPESFERRIQFPRLRLYPARVAFILMSLVNNTLRKLLNLHGPGKKPRHEP